MASVVCPDRPNEPFTGSPIYTSPDATAVAEALVEKFSECVLEGPGRVRINEEFWSSPGGLKLQSWLRKNFCGYGYHNSVLSVHPLTIRVL